MKKIYKKNKGITLIAIVITIIVMLILVSVTIKLVLDGGLFEYAQKAKQKYAEAEKIDLEEIDKFITLIENSSSVWNGEVFSDNGMLKIPISINDCSSYYKLDIESEKYTGPVLLNVYSQQEGQYFGKITVNNNEAYVWKTRNFLQTTQTDDNSTDITYSGQKNNEEDSGLLTVNTEKLGSELKLKSIYKIAKKYSLIGNLILKLKSNQDINVNDIIPFIDYALDYGDLGYDLVNKEQSNLNVNDNTERDLLNNIKTNKKGDIEALEKAIRNNIITCLSPNIFSVSNKNVNLYTLADYVEENPYLVEFYNKLIGNTIVPFMITYLNDFCLPDLNQDGRVAKASTSLYSVSLAEGEDEETNIAINQNYVYKLNNYAGFAVRCAADYFSVSNKNNKTNMTETEEALLKEVDNVFSNTLSTLRSFWNQTFEAYHGANMNNMYKKLYDANININIAGIRLGYYSLASSFASRLRELGLDFHDDEYNYKNDSKYIKMQGLEDYIDML